MISTMLAIKEATEEALFDHELMGLAQFIFKNHEHMENDEFAQLLFKYSASLSALTATLVSSICLSESDMSDMIATMKEMNQLTEEMEQPMNTTAIATEDFLKATIAKQEERINDLVLHSQRLAQRDYDTAGTLQKLRDDLHKWTMNALEEASINEAEAQEIADIAGFELTQEFELEVSVQYSMTVNAKNLEEAMNAIHDLDLDSISYDEPITYLSGTIDRIDIQQGATNGPEHVLKLLHKSRGKHF